MIDGIMKAFFKFANISPEQGKQMVEGTYKVVQSIGADMQSINNQLADIRQHLGIETKSVNGVDTNATPHN